MITVDAQSTFKALSGFEFGVNVCVTLALTLDKPTVYAVTLRLKRAQEMIKAIFDGNFETVKDAIDEFETQVYNNQTLKSKGFIVDDIDEFFDLVMDMIVQCFHKLEQIDYDATIFVL